MSSFFVRQAGGYRACESTRGPWSDVHQHGGPPAALLAREMERAMPPEMRVARLTVEFLRPVPLALLSVSSEVTKAGRKVSWLSAVASCEGREVARATAVAIRRAPVPVPVPDPTLALPPPARASAFVLPFFTTAVGYHTGMELKIARGTWGSGAVAAWMRMRVPLLEGEEPSPLQRVAVAADSGNGVSKALDERRFLFMNPELSIHLHREPAGEWVCLDARTVLAADGTGLAETDLSDERGPIGRSHQALLLEER